MIFFWKVTHEGSLPRVVAASEPCAKTSAISRPARLGIVAEDLRMPSGVWHFFSKLEKGVCSIVVCAFVLYIRIRGRGLASGRHEDGIFSFEIELWVVGGREERERYLWMGRRKCHLS